MRVGLFALLLVLLPLIAVSQTAKTAKWTILPLVHPDAKLLLGVDWRRVLDSPLGPIMLKQVQQGGHPLLGFLDSIENMDRILLSSPGAGEEGRAPLLVIGEGRFALAKIRAMAKADGAISRKYNDTEMLVPPGASGADLHFALINEQTILFGDGISVKGAIDRWQRTTPGHDRNPVYYRAVTLSTMQEVWAVASEPSVSLAALGMNGSTLSEQIENLELGMSFSKNLEATVWIKAATEEAGEMLATGLPALLQIAALQCCHQPSLMQMAKRIKVMNEKNYIKMAIVAEAKLFDQSLNELRASAAQPTTVTRAVPLPGAAPTAAAALPPPVDTTPQRRVVRIVGMDEGTREIPYEVKRAN